MASSNIHITLKFQEDSMLQFWVLEYVYKLKIGLALTLYVYKIRNGEMEYNLQ